MYGLKPVPFQLKPVPFKLTRYLVCPAAEGGLHGV
jgi:hypothetical protein